MINFKRGKSSKESLNIGIEKYYKDLWNKKIHYKDIELKHFLNTEISTWYKTEMNFKTGEWKVWDGKENNLKNTVIGKVILTIHIEELVKIIDNVVLPVPF